MNQNISIDIAYKEKVISELFDFLRFPSVSSKSEHKEDVRNCARWLSNHLQNLGVNNVNLFETAGNPIVFGEYVVDPKKPTVLIYGHYDVQPVEPMELWNSQPFEPKIVGNKIYARGASDDKGQLFIHLKAFELLKNSNRLRINVKFLFEGEEEAGSSHLEDFIVNNIELLKSDVAVISDTEWFAEGVPSICYSLRGICFAEIYVYGPNRDLHSGSYGGAVDNPAQVLVNILAGMKDNYGRVAIPGFYENVSEISEEEKHSFRALPFTEVEFANSIGVPALYGEFGYSVLERIWVRPSFEINGIVSGYIGEGAKTIIPSVASAKISMRLVPNQQPDEIFAKLNAFVKEIAPPTVKIELRQLHGGKPVFVPIDSIWIRKAQQALRLAFGKEPAFIREGGSIPICETFQSVLGIPPILLGFGLPTDNIHSPNENLDLDNFFGGIRAIAIYYDLLGAE